MTKSIIIYLESTSLQYCNHKLKIEELFFLIGTPGSDMLLICRFDMRYDVGVAAAATELTGAHRLGKWNGGIWSRVPTVVVLTGCSIR